MELPDLEVECVGHADAYRRLIDGSSSSHQRALCCVAEQPLVFDVGMDLPLRINPILHLRAEAGRVCAALGVEDGQPGGYCLHRIDAEIGRGRLSALPGEPRPRRDGEPLNHRHDKISRKVDDRAVMTAQALSNFGSYAKPVDGIVFDKAAKLHRSLYVAQSIQLGVVIALASRDKLRGRAGTKIAEIDQRDTGAVARRTERLRRPGPTDGKDRDRAEHRIFRSLEAGSVFTSHPDHDSPVSRYGRQNWQLERRGRQRKRRLSRCWIRECNYGAEPSTQCG